jgi:hypothetical protein
MDRLRALAPAQLGVGAVSIAALALAVARAAATSRARNSSSMPSSARVVSSSTSSALSIPAMKALVRAVLEEYLLSADAGEAARTLSRVVVVSPSPASSSSRAVGVETVKQAVTLLLDRSDADGERLASLLVQLVVSGSGVLTIPHLTRGLQIAAARLQDAALDNPRAPTRIADLVAFLVQSDVVPDDLFSSSRAAEHSAACEEAGVDSSLASLASFELLAEALDASALYRTPRSSPLGQLRTAYSAALAHYVASGGAGLDMLLRQLASMQSRHTLYEFVRKVCVAAVEGAVAAPAASTTGRPRFGLETTPALVRELCSDLLSSLVEIGLVSPFAAAAGVALAVRGLPDLVLDHPSAVALLATFAARGVADRALPVSFAEGCEKNQAVGAAAPAAAIYAAGPDARRVALAHAALAAVKASLPATVASDGVVTDEVHARMSACWGWRGRPLAVVRQAAVEAGEDFVADVLGGASASAAAAVAGAGAGAPSTPRRAQASFSSSSSSVPAGLASPSAALAARISSGGASVSRSGSAAEAPGSPGPRRTDSAAASASSSSSTHRHDPEAEFARHLAALAREGGDGAAAAALAAAAAPATPVASSFDALHNEAVRAVVAAAVGAPAGAAARVSSLLSSLRHSGALSETSLRVGLARALEGLFFEPPSPDAQRLALPFFLSLLLFLTRTGSLAASPTFFETLPAYLLEAAAEDDEDAAEALSTTTGGAAGAAAGQRQRHSSVAASSAGGSLVTMLRARYEQAAAGTGAGTGGGKARES